MYRVDAPLAYAVCTTPTRSDRRRSSPQRRVKSPIRVATSAAILSQSSRRVSFDDASR
jgi:hypothetical protein